MEQLIWFCVPVISALLTARVIRRPPRGDVVAAAVLGLLGLAFGPSCLCRDGHLVLIPLAAAFGVLAFLLLHFAIKLHARFRS